VGEKAYYWQETRRCGRSWCSRCPHGPYWFGHVDGKRRYFGKTDPRPSAKASVPFHEGTTDVVLASVFLGVGLWQSYETALAIYAVALESCADGGPQSVSLRSRLIAAWNVLCVHQGWNGGKKGGNV